MKSTGKLLIILLIAAAILCAGFFSGYNKMVTLQETVERSYADIGTQLQRRSDLIPNLVSTVSGIMAHEQAIIDTVTQSREALLGAKTVADQANADQALSQSLNSLLAIAESYPELKSNENFIRLQDELAGTENRIAVARRDYNTTVEQYNAHIKKFPNMILANLMGFHPAPYFEAQANAMEVPHVTF